MIFVWNNALCIVHRVITENTHNCKIWGHKCERHIPLPITDHTALRGTQEDERCENSQVKEPHSDKIGQNTAWNVQK